MPAFCNSYRVGDIVKIDEGGGSKLEFVIKKIGGTRRNRMALLYLIENGRVTNKKELRQERKDDKPLSDGIYACIPSSSKSGSGRVKISFWFLDDYKVIEELGKNFSKLEKNQDYA
jgi:hypothetical protein